jgi:hypothetical protein
MYRIQKLAFRCASCVLVVSITTTAVSDGSGRELSGRVVYRDSLVVDQGKQRRRIDFLLKIFHSIHCFPRHDFRIKQLDGSQYII